MRAPGDTAPRSLADECVERLLSTVTSIVSSGTTQGSEILGIVFFVPLHCLWRFLVPGCDDLLTAVIAVCFGATQAV